jgi:hypothetical protein
MLDVPVFAAAIYASGAATQVKFRVLSFMVKM